MRMTRHPRRSLSAVTCYSGPALPRTLSLSRAASISQGKFCDVGGPSVKVSERYPWELCSASKLVLCENIKKFLVNRPTVPFRSLSDSDPRNEQIAIYVKRAAALIGILSIGGLFPEKGGVIKQGREFTRALDRLWVFSLFQVETL